jgi:hypothetical protein
MNPALVPALFGLGSQLITETAEARQRVRTGQRTSIPRRASIRTGALGNNLPGQGAIQCPGIDLDKYRDECRCPIYRDMWNVWRLLRTTADGVTADEMQHRTEAFMQLVSSSLDGKVRHLEVKPGALSNPWDTPVQVSRNSVCMTPFSLRASDNAPAYHEVFVRFVYRGLETTIPWPSMRKDAGVFGVDCPTDATWLLDAVFTPSQIDVPEQASDSPFPVIVDPHNKVDPRGPDLDFGTKIALWGGLGLLVAVALGYAVRSFK